MKGFVLTGEGVVQPSWIDANGHMNVMWYTALFDQGCDSLLRRVGISPETIAAGQPTLVAARLLTAHRRELFADAVWQLWSGFSRVEPAGVCFTHRLVAGTTTHASCDIQSYAFCPVTRRPTTLGEAVLLRAQALLVPGLRDAFAPNEAAR
jgi:acyl-CoA thioesterase FadM